MSKSDLREACDSKNISEREFDVVHMVAKGLSNKEVANQLFVTEKTVKFHLTNIYRKFQVKSRAQLIVWCLPFLGVEPAKIEKPVARKDISPGPLASGEMNIPL